MCCEEVVAVVELAGESPAGGESEVVMMGVGFDPEVRSAVLVGCG